MVVILQVNVVTVFAVQLSILQVFAPDCALMIAGTWRNPGVATVNVLLLPTATAAVICGVAASGPGERATGMVP